MSGYNVDDILEEVRRKRERESARTSRPAAESGERYAPRSRETTPAYSDWNAPRERRDSGYAEQPLRREPQREYDARRDFAAYDESGYGQMPRERSSYDDTMRYAQQRTSRETGYYETSYPAREENYPRENSYDAPARRDRYYAEEDYRSAENSRRQTDYEPALRDERQTYTQERRSYSSYENGYDAPQKSYRQNEEDVYERAAYDALRSARNRMKDSVPMPPPVSPPMTVKRRTPRPSMDDLMQNFGEGVGMGRGLDPNQPLSAVRRNTPIVGQTQPQMDTRPFGNRGMSARREDENYGADSFDFRLSSNREAPAYEQAYAPKESAYSPSEEYDSRKEQTFAPPEESSSRFSYSAKAPDYYTPSESAEDPVPEQDLSFEEEREYQEDFAPEQEPEFSPESSFASDFELKPEPSDTSETPDWDASEPSAPSFSSGSDSPTDLFERMRMESTRIMDDLPENDLFDGKKFGSDTSIPLAPEDTQDDGEMDERYETDEEEREGILSELKRTRRSILVRLGLTAISFLSLFYFGMAYLNPAVPTFPFMWAEGETMRTFLIVNLLFVIGTMFVNFPVIGGGLVNLCTLRANGDSLIALSLLASVIQGVSLVITPSAADFGNGIHLYFCIPVFGLVLNLLGRLMQARRIELGARVACAQGDKYVMRTLKSEDFSRELSRGLPVDLPEITYSVKSRYVGNYLDASYASDYAEGINRMLAFIVLGASILVSYLTYYLFWDTTVYSTLSVFSALLAVCAPATSTIVSNLPMLRAAAHLQKSGAAIVGYPVVEEYSDVRAVTFKARELFPADSIVLNGMKVFQETKIESAILDAASVICATDSPLMPIFQSMINSNDKILKSVENVVYEDGMGLSAWVDGKRVLIGNAQLMRNHSVVTPSRDYEQRMVGDGKELLYLANSGELVAMFALTYSSDRRVSAQMQELADSEVALIIHTTDPNVTPARISSLFHYPERLVKIVPATLHADYDRVTAPRNRVRASILYSGTMMSMFRALGMIGRIKGCVTAGTACQFIEMLIGYALITFYAFFAGMSYLSFYILLIYQLVWAAVIVLIESLRKI